MSTSAARLAPDPPAAPPGPTGSLATLAAGCWPLLVGMGLLALANGLAFSLVGLRISAAGFSPLVTGVVLSAYSIGYVSGSVLAPRLVAGVGHVRVFGALASSASIAALVQAVAGGAFAWFATRFATGLCYAGLYVVAESWLNDRALDAARGRLLAIYMLVVLVGFGLGPLLLNAADPDGPLLFVVLSALVSLAAVPILLASAPAPAFRAAQPLGLVALYRSSPLGVAASAATGLSNGALLGLGAVFADRVGMPIAAVSAFMSASVFGAIALMWPIGHASDRFDRRVVLAVVTALAALAAVAVALLGAHGLVPAVAAIALFGGLSYPMYSLSLAHANDRLPPERMVAASSALVLLTGLGASTGPFAGSGAMSLAGPTGLFWFLAAVHAALAAFALWRMTRRPATPLEEQLPPLFVPRTSPVSAAAAADASREQAHAVEDAR